MRNDFYRPAAAAVFEAALDAQGQPLALNVGTAGDAIMPRYYERTYPLMAPPIDLPDTVTAEGLFELPYALDHLRVSHSATRHEVPVGSWRSVGHSQNGFFAEAFIDELAEAAGADPVAFRLQRLAHLPRHEAVLKLAAEKAGWGSTLPAARARGVALHESYNSIVAMVIEASIELRDGKREPRVHRVVAAVDCGTAVNPGIVAQQIESAVVFGLSAALFGRIDIEDGRVRQGNFNDYRLLTLAATPLIETHLVPSTRVPGGMGEPGLPPVAPALANALYKLTGKRIRELPITL
jgi:isoquinoline 1-oxidoreductase beta subunit